MKKYLYYFLFTFSLFVGCSKNDGPVPKDIILERTPEPQVTKTGGSQSIDVTSLASFQAEFSVGVYYTSEIQPSKYDVVVRKNDNDTTVKIFKKDITTFPTSLTITTNDLETLFGEPIVLGDNYDIGVNMYMESGKKYEAFPLVGTGYGSGISQQPGATPSIRYSAICQYHDEVYQGDFKIIKDEWQEVSGDGGYDVGAIVTVTRIDATHFSFKYPASDALPIIVKVNPLTNEISVAKQVYTPSGYGWGYGAISCQSTTSDTRNIVSPCDEKFGIALIHTVSIGAFTDKNGAYIEMQKVN
jgi:hypothetical protein